MSRRRYSTAERAQALDLAAQEGMAEAARRLGVPEGTLKSWAHRAAQLPAVVAAVDLEPTGELLPWPERRARLLPAVGDLAAQAVDAASKAIAEGRSRDARDLAVVAGVAIDKGQLLGGGPTSRHESRQLRVDVRAQAEIRAEVQRLRDELGYPDAIEVTGA